MTKTIFLIIFLILSNIYFAYTKFFFLPGESIAKTHYLYADNFSDSLDFVKLFDRNGNFVDVSISTCQSHFIPDGRPNLRLIKVEFSMKIPNDFNYPDSLFRFGLKSRHQYDTTYDYFFYILKENPTSTLSVILPKNNSIDVSITPTFQWKEESNPAIRFYNFQFSDDSNFKKLLVDTNLLTNKFFLNQELIPNTKYYWRVKSDYFTGDSNYHTANFTTGAKTTWEYFEIEKYHNAQDIQMLDSGRLILTDHQVGFLISDDNGLSWRTVKTPDFIHFKVLPPTNNNIFAFGFDYNKSQYKIFKSTNNGNSWAVFKLLNGSSSYQTDRKFTYFINANNELIFAFKNQLFKYKNIEMNELVYSVALDTSLITGFAELRNGNIVAVTSHIYIDKDADRGEIYLINENGKQVKKIFQKDSIHTDFIALNLLENGYLLASAQIETVDTKSANFYLSINNGETWELVSSINNSKIINTINSFDGDLYAHLIENQRQIILSKDYGKTWITISGNIPTNNTAFDIKILNDSTLYYLSNSNRLYRTNIRSGIEISISPKSKSTAETNKIEIKWRNNQRALKYNLQIAENSEFKKIGSLNENSVFIDEELNENTFIFNNFKFDKTYYWRVRPYYEDKWMDWYPTIDFEITDISSVFENIDLFEIEIFPNPAQDFLNVNMGNYSKIEIYNIDGEIVFSSKNIVENIEVSELQKGTYFIRIYKDNVVYKAKFIKN